MGTSLTNSTAPTATSVRGSGAATIDRIYAWREGLWHLYGTDAAGRGRGSTAKPHTMLGADDGIRTHDTWLGKPVLYQLSYVREA